MGVALLPQVSRRWFRLTILLTIFALLLFYLSTRSLGTLSGCAPGAQPCITEAPPPLQKRRVQQEGQQLDLRNNFRARLGCLAKEAQQARGSAPASPAPVFTPPGPAAFGIPGGPGAGRASVSGPPGDAGPLDEAVPRLSEPRRGRGAVAVPGGMEGANQVPNSLRLHLHLRHKRGFLQSDSPRGSGARPRCRALQIAGGHGGVGAAGGAAGAARDRPRRLGLANPAPAAPGATLVPALPPPGGDREVRRPGRRRAVRRRLPHRPGPAPRLAGPSGRPPRVPVLPGPRPPAGAGVSGNRGGGGAGRARPRRGHAGGGLQPDPGLAGRARPAPAGLRPAAAGTRGESALGRGWRRAGRRVPPSAVASSSRAWGARYPASLVTSLLGRPAPVGWGVLAPPSTLSPRKKGGAVGNKMNSLVAADLGRFL